MDFSSELKNSKTANNTAVLSVTGWYWTALIVSVMLTIVGTSLVQTGHNKTVALMAMGALSLAFRGRSALVRSVQDLLQCLADEHAKELNQLREEHGRECFAQIRRVEVEKLVLVAKEINRRIVVEGLKYGAQLTYAAPNPRAAVEAKEYVRRIQGFFRSAGNPGADVMLEFASDEEGDE